MRLVVVIPVYNEAALLERAIARLEATPALPGGERVERVLVLVDDGSTDGSTELVRAMEGAGRAHAVVHARNRGKGAALRTGFQKAMELGADVVLVQDADLEYDPADHGAVLAPILDGRADAVIGSRFIGTTHRVLYYWHFLANRFITLCSNALTNLNLSDIECCSKAMTRAALERITIEEDRFGVEPELVAKLARLRLPDERDAARVRQTRIYEVAVSYAGRTYEEGKKITWRDGVRALVCIVKYNLR
ncbi:MAG: glycosyltransferase family 2 protein [Phycisphaerales bacterium]|nr:MAG: glycosyltransferase family 2 protein [Phycisphaerales bacterium]